MSRYVEMVRQIIDGPNCNRINDLLSQLEAELINAHTDIRQWVRLAKVWQASLPENHPLSPTSAAIKASEAIVGPVKDPEPEEICPRLQQELHSAMPAPQTNSFGVYGMTLRDYFAAHLVQLTQFDPAVMRQTAKAAYAMADALIEARKERSNG